MRIEVRPSEKSTEERPLWVWRVWHGGREVGFGIVSTQEEATARATTAVRTRAARYVGGLVCIYPSGLEAE